MTSRQARILEIIETARAKGVPVYAARNGILGALNEELIDTSKESVAAIRKEMQQIMDRDVGIFRDEKGLTDACAKLATLRQRFVDVGVADKDRVFNTELQQALELDFMLDVAQAIAWSALNRRESRGAHSRTDFTTRDDANYLKHSLAFRTDGAPRIDYLPVQITKWQPQGRKD